MVVVYETGNFSMCGLLYAPDKKAQSPQRLTGATDGIWKCLVIVTIRSA